MPHRAMLTPADDLFGRVALFNSLVTLDQIIECARVIGAEMVAGRPRRSLATMLILKGYLSAKAAGSVETAIRRRHAGKGAPEAAASPGEAPPAQAPPPKPPVLSERAPSGNSQILVTLEDDGFVESPQTEDRLKRVVSRIAPGLVYPELLSHIVRHRLSVIDGHALAAAVGESEEDVFAAMRYWASAGILRKVGTHPYCYAPDQRDEQDVAFLLEAWHDSRRHARVLGFILAAHQ